MNLPNDPVFILQTVACIGALLIGIVMLVQQARRQSAERKEQRRRERWARAERARLARIDAGKMNFPGRSGRDVW